ncbi:EpsI family protein [Alteromonas sp. 5E99-2]|uniref:exosortase A n=1 Tax=Alteromonas sp. 5E99-2 TaxID=2817683 RepID=UPI001A98A695|nr:exosortase A [Alteromonas sp. 5E99-2]MBO1256547.1 EpsI family protein [Alteromonas sp. 5E99-2]
MTKIENVSAEYRPLCFIGLLLIASWFGFAYDGFSSAVAIWYGNEIFNHGFLILPGAIYFAYIKRGKWLALPIQPTLWALPFLIGGIFLYVVGYAGDIQLFMHAATFGLIPVICWVLLGHKATFALIFPLSFIFYAIPFGEQFIPQLQEITADIAVYLLQLTGIPLYRSGLYIEIPQGRFLVAEACSGISFFIASTVVGAVYSYLNFVSTKKRVAFFALSVIYPIIANAVRVYGIILIGYWSDMKHAVGADHLIYGWFFFAFVLISLLAIGEFIRDKQIVTTIPVAQDHTPIVKISKPISGLAILLFIAGIVWIKWIDIQSEKQITASPIYLSVPAQFIDKTSLYGVNYKPDLRKPSDEVFKVSKNNLGTDVIYQAWFNGESNELVSGLHRLYSEKSWSLVSQHSLVLADIAKFNVRLISNPSGNKRLITTWYEIDERIFVNDGIAKLYQTKQALLGQNSGGFRVIVSVPVDNKTTSEKDAMLRVEALLLQIIGGKE